MHECHLPAAAWYSRLFISHARPLFKHSPRCHHSVSLCSRLETTDLTFQMTQYIPFTVTFMIKASLRQFVVQTMNHSAPNCVEFDKSVFWFSMEEFICFTELRVLNLGLHRQDLGNSQPHFETMYVNGELQGLNSPWTSISFWHACDCLSSTSVSSIALRISHARLVK